MLLFLAHRDIVNGYTATMHCNIESVL